MPGHRGQRGGPAERSFGRLLRELRGERGLTQERLAELAGFDRGFVGLLERGLSSPTLSTILRLARVLQTNASELVAQVEAEVERLGTE